MVARPLAFAADATGAVGLHRQVGGVADRPCDRRSARRSCLTAIFVFCLTTMPFCPVIVVGIVSGLAHRFAVRRQRAVRADRQVHRDAADRHVGRRRERRRRDAFFDVGVADQDRPSRRCSRAPGRGPGTPRRRATRGSPGPVILPGSVGVTTVAPPTNEPLGQFIGLAANCASVHAFCSVVRRDGSAFGNCTFTDLMFAWPATGVTVVVRLAPLAFDVFALVEALKLRLEFQRVAVADLERLDSVLRRSPPRRARSRSASSRSPAGCSWSGCTGSPAC